MIQVLKALCPFVVGGLMLGAPAAALAQTPSPDAIDPASEKPDKALLDKLLAGENKYWSAWKAKDWATVRKMMGEDGIWVDPLNVYATEGFIKAVENSPMEFSIVPRAYLRKPTTDVAVLVYDVKVGFGRAGAAPPTAEWRWLLSCVFVNRGGQWVGVSRSEVRGNRPTTPASGNP